MGMCLFTVKIIQMPFLFGEVKGVCEIAVDLSQTQISRSIKRQMKGNNMTT